MTGSERVERARGRREALRTAMMRLETLVKDAPTTPDGLGAIRRQVRNLLSSLAEHRQRGADLVYDAYKVDISVGD